MKILQHQLAKVEGHSTKEIERTKQLQTIEMQMEYEKRRALTEVKRDEKKTCFHLIEFFRRFLFFSGRKRSNQRSLSTVRLFIFILFFFEKFEFFRQFQK